MPVVHGISFVWALVILGVIIAVYGLRAALGYRSVAQDARDDFDYKTQHGMSVYGLTKDGYLRAYRRYHNPRAPLYVAATLSAIVLLTPVLFIIISFLLEQLYQASGRSRVFEPGFLVWQFSIYMMVLGAWAGIAYFGARTYHRRAPGTLSQEMAKEMEAPAGLEA